MFTDRLSSETMLKCRQKLQFEPNSLFSAVAVLEGEVSKRSRVLVFLI